MDFEGPVTLLFTDVEGSTELRTRHGDNTSQAMIRAHEEVVRAEITRHGGREVKALGDGFMVAFTSARKAIACATGIQRAMRSLRFDDGDALRVRIGLNTGEVMSENGDLYGEAVHAAARIAAAACGGEILASNIVKELAGTVPDVRFKDRGRVPLRGFPEARQLFEIEWETKERARLPGEKTPYVGRQGERAELLRLVADAVAGHGSVVLLAGEPGVGKTRLAEEVADDARRRGMLTLIGRCYDTDVPPPYLPIVEILEAAARGAARSEALREALGDVAGEIARIVPELRRIFPDIPLPIELPPEQERRYLFNSIASFMERAARLRPQLLILDDLHWADESTLLLLIYLAEQVPDLPILIIGTYRDVELDVSRPLANTLQELLRRRLAHRVAVKRLPEEAVAQMLQALSGEEAPGALVQVLFEETEGNPFFVEEVFHYLNDEGRLFDDQGHWRTDIAIGELDVPEGVRLVIGRRLQRLSDTTRRALCAGAVIGRRFPYALLRAVTDIEENALLDALDEAERARLLISTTEAGEDRLMFAHELIRQTLLTSVSAPRRRKLHAEAATAIELVYPDELPEHAAEIVRHLEAAGAGVDAARLVRYLCMAGERALASAAYEDALRYFEDALASSDEAADLERAELLWRLGLAQRGLRNIQEALETWNDALALFEGAGAVARVTQVCLDIAQQLAWASLWPECLQMVARGLAAGEGQPEVRARLLGLSGIIVANTGDHDTALGLIQQGLDLAEQVGDPLLVAYGNFARALIHHAYMELDLALSTGLAGTQDLKEAGALWDLASFLGFMQFGLFFLGRWDEAEQVGQELEPLARRLGHLGALVFAMRSRPNPGFLYKDLDAIEAFVEMDMELSEQVGPLHLAQVALWKALLEFWRGDWEAAEAGFDRAVAIEAPGVWAELQSAYQLLFRCYAGDAERARAMVDAHRDRLPVPGRLNHWGAWTTLLCAVEGLFLIGERDDAAALYPLVIECRDTGLIGRPFDMRWCETLAGIAAFAGRAWDRAEEHFEEARRKCDRLRNDGERHDIDRFHGWMLLERGGVGDRERGLELLERARSGYRSVGMERFAELTVTPLERELQPEGSGR